MAALRTRTLERMEALAGALCLVWLMANLWVGLIQTTVLEVARCNSFVHDFLHAWRHVDGFFDLLVLVTGLGVVGLRNVPIPRPLLLSGSAIALLCLSMSTNPHLHRDFGFYLDTSQPSFYAIRVLILTFLFPLLLSVRDFDRLFGAVIGLIAVYAMANIVLGSTPRLWGCALRSNEFAVFSWNEFLFARHKNNLGAVIFFLPGACLAMGERAQNRWVRGFFRLLAATVLIQVFLLNSQSAAVAAFVTLLPFLLPFLKPVRAERMVAVAGTGVGLALLLFLVLPSVRSYLQRYGLHTREGIWAAALLELRERGEWWTGTRHWFSPKGTHTHSVPLYLLTYFGAFAALLHVGLLGTIYSVLIKRFEEVLRTRMAQVLLYASIGSLLISMVTMFAVVGRSVHFLTFWFFLGACLARVTEGKPSPSESPNPGWRIGRTGPAWQSGS